MRRKSFNRLTAWLGMVGAVLGSGALAQAQSAKPEPPRDVVIQRKVVERDTKVGEESANAEAGSSAAKEGKANANVEGDVVLELKVNDDEQAPLGRAPGERRLEQRRERQRVVARLESGYWIGLQLEPPSDALRSQLGLAEGQGLVVEAVMSDSPASKAGFQRFDVVTKINDAAASDIEAFNRIVADAKDAKELAVTVVRGGKPQEIKVKAAKRPQVIAEPDRAYAELRRVFPGRFPETGAVEQPMRVDVFHPGVLYYGDAGELPKNLSVSISKSGGEPAKITVKKDNTTWEVTEKELDKLPADVRPHVERMLGGGHGQFNIAVPPNAFNVVPHGAGEGDGPGWRERIVVPFRPGKSAEEVDKRFQDINDKLEAIQKAVDALSKQGK